ncbi:Phage integrase family protein [Planctomicrobium piriforme]|uniref:Phage integrase family protein n=1 Tax=Planctomicrobium piriforme TaxID=1576369 RepID=A0A1I3SLT2_9PLAN|nr:Phage integrase family protein [Planctomicrobium piriforme]
MKKKKIEAPKHKVPKVRIARPSGRPFQLRYKCPVEKREIRISVGSRDEDEAQLLKSQIEARLLLGLETKPGKAKPNGPEMPWAEFREQFRILHLMTLRDGSASHSESRLDLAERILKPKKLGDMAEPSALQQLQAQLLTGSHSRRKRPRSAHTVRGYMNSVLAALNWAFLQGWLNEAPKIRKIKTPKQKTMKGRPITEAEFQQMLDATADVVGLKAVESWKHVLHGLWESALRLDELMHVSWDRPGMIRPVWKKNQLPVLEIPAAMQKNDSEECIPLLPWFEAVLQETATHRRTGWVFEPQSLQTRLGRRIRHKRPDSQWVGKVISKIGEAAGILVEAADERTGRPEKYASAHDLRRSCGERLREAGVPPLVITRVMRHSSWETTRKHYAPGDIQKDAQVLVSVLGAAAVPTSTEEPPQVYPENLGTPEGVICRKSLHPSGLEPLTFGSVDRCSIQLS